MAESGNAPSSYLVDTEEKGNVGLSWKICNLVKCALFLLLWVYSAVYLITTVPKRPSTFLVPLMPYNKYVINSREKLQHSDIGIQLVGPIDKILTLNPEWATNSNPRILVKVESFNALANFTEMESESWIIFLLTKQNEINERISKQFRLKSKPSVMRSLIYQQHPKRAKEFDMPIIGVGYHELHVLLTNYYNDSLAVFVVISYNPVSTNIAVAGGILLLLFLYVLIILDLADSAFAVMLVAMGGIGLLCMMHARPELNEIISWIDIENIMRALSLMLIMLVVEKTIIFDLIVTIVYQLSRGKIWLLVLILCWSAAIGSALLDNITVVLLMGPVTFRLCQKLALCTTVMLISITVFANIGNALSPLTAQSIHYRDIILDIKKQRISYGSFFLHVLPGVFFSMVLGSAVLYCLIRKRIYGRSQLFGSVSALTAHAERLNKIDAQLSYYYERRIIQLKTIKIAQNSEVRQIDFQETLAEMKATCTVTNFKLLIACIVALSFTIVLYVLEYYFAQTGISRSWLTIYAAVLLLILSNMGQFELLLNRVDWWSLIFFAALLVLFRSIRYLGMEHLIASMVRKVIYSADKDQKLLISIVLMTSMSALESAFMPYLGMKSAMVSEAISLSENVGLPHSPLVWSIIYGCSFGENGNMISSFTNVLVIGFAHRQGFRISFWNFFVISFPIMLTTVLIANTYLTIAHLFWNWHEKLP
ncbi:P protein-like [Drosophila hydei]|uniref:P protein-like n=1 Tax=Drosophila hydei TaxID=7224 RepID=A0A6J1L303_DROHY|nr:P protein-like [Drosophila hydei]